MPHHLVRNDPTDSHFSEGRVAGRSEDEIAAALGDPVRLARELRAEAGFKRWESERTPGSLAGDGKPCRLSHMRSVPAGNPVFADSCAVLSSGLVIVATR